jgi:hypothetical protein
MHARVLSVPFLVRVRPARCPICRQGIRDVIRVYR